MNTDPFAVYTLHAAFPNARPIHYTGITHIKNTFHRIRQHMHGHGSKFTKRQYDKGASWHLVNLQTVPTLDQEWVCKGQWRAPLMCPLCQSGFVPPSTRLPLNYVWSPHQYP